jgi:hypothetical protein
MSFGLQSAGCAGIGKTGVEPCAGEGLEQCLCSIHHSVFSCLVLTGSFHFALRTKIQSSAAFSDTKHQNRHCLVYTGYYQKIPVVFNINPDQLMVRPNKGESIHDKFAHYPKTMAVQHLRLKPGIGLLRNSRKG